MQVQLREIETSALMEHTALRGGDCDIDALGALRRRPVFTDKDNYAVQVADSDGGRAAALQLIHERYSRRGYRVSEPNQQNPFQTTLGVLAGCAFVGTATLQVDSPFSVGADAVFKDHVDAYRHDGAHVCEITRFALARGVCSQTVLAAVFHSLYILAFQVAGCSHVFIEVNPRHRKFYETVFGFECLTQVRNNPRVNAPAHLMQVRTDYLASEIFYPSNGASFPRFFSSDDEERIREKFARRCSLQNLGARPAAPRTIAPRLDRQDQ